MPFFLHTKGADVAACLAFYETQIPQVTDEHTSSPRAYRLHWPGNHFQDVDYVPSWACSKNCIPCCLEQWRDKYSISLYNQSDADRDRTIAAMRGPIDPATVPYLGVYFTAQTAQTARTLAGKHAAVTFAVSSIEADIWRERERARIGGNGCVRVPWCDETWYYEHHRELHFAYLSVEKPGLVAFTPSEEWGVTDRQLRVRPGKYLEQFAAHLSAAQRDELCAQVKAVNDRNVIRFATSPADVVKVYRTGPSSCMSHSPDSYSSSQHPTVVYADSPDLKLSYLGVLGNRSDDPLRARALVWPEKKIYSRVYGDTTLRILLEREGYTNGSLSGARVRAMAEHGNDAYIMPFVDGCEYVTLHRDRKHFVLCEESGDYVCQNTNGLTDGEISGPADDDDYGGDTYFCQACGDVEVNDDGDTCRRCYNRRYTCAECDSTFYDDDSREIDNHGTVCEGCYDRLAHTCGECDETYFPVTFTEDETDNRREHGIDNQGLCLDCGNDRIASVKEQQAKDADDARRASIVYSLETALRTNSFRGDAQ